MSGADVFSKIGTTVLYKMGFNDFSPYPKSLQFIRNTPRGKQMWAIIEEDADRPRATTFSVVLDRKVVASKMAFEKVVPAIESLLA